MSYSYKEQDFKRCLYNPLSKSKLAAEQRLQALFPVINEEEDAAVLFLDEVPRETLLRYIVCLYDPESPLLKEPSLAIRKTEAARIAGYDLEAYEQWLEDELYSCKNPVVLHVIAKYLEMRRSREFAGLMADEQTYWEFTKRLMEPISKGEKETDIMRALDIKTKLSEAKEIINARLTTNWNKFFAGDDEAIQQATTISIWTPEAAAGVFR